MKPLSLLLFALFSLQISSPSEVLNRNGLRLVTLEVISISGLIDGSASFEVRIKNCSSEKIAIVKPNLKYPLKFNNNCWNIELVADSSRVIYSPKIHVDYFVSKEDYILISPKCEYRFQIEIQLNDIQSVLIDDDSTIKHSSNLFEELKLCIVYKDPVRKNRKAVKEKLQSNWIVLIK